MIPKPDSDMRRSFWHADAWAAARAERMGHWHTPDPDHPVASRIIVGTFLIGALMNGVMIFAITLGGLILCTEGGNLLRRVLMYWSIRRYGAWREMAPEMRETLDNPSDLAERPTRFAAMPRGFTSTAEVMASDRRRDYSKASYPLLFLTLCILVAMLVD
jgi:hypothetical protein